MYEKFISFLKVLEGRDEDGSENFYLNMAKDYDHLKAATDIKDAIYNYLTAVLSLNKDNFQKQASLIQSTFKGIKDGLTKHKQALDNIIGKENVNAHSFLDQLRIMTGLTTLSSLTQQNITSLQSGWINSIKVAFKNEVPNKPLTADTVLEFLKKQSAPPPPVMPRSVSSGIGENAYQISGISAGFQGESTHIRGHFYQSNPILSFSKAVPSIFDKDLQRRRRQTSTGQGYADKMDEVLARNLEQVKRGELLRERIILTPDGKEVKQSLSEYEALTSTSDLIIRHAIHLKEFIQFMNETKQEYKKSLSDYEKLSLISLWIISLLSQHKILLKLETFFKQIDDLEQQKKSASKARLMLLNTKIEDMRADLLVTHVDFFEYRNEIERVYDQQEKITQQVCRLLTDWSEYGYKTSFASILDDDLKNSARQFGFDCINVAGDGNCFFHAVLEQLHRNGLYTEVTDSKILRQIVTMHIINNIDLYKEVAGEMAQFVLNTSKPGEWADHIVIQALSRELNLTMAIVNSDKSIPAIILRREVPQATIYLGYQREYHYQSLVQNPHYKAEINMEGIIQAADVDMVEFTRLSEAEKNQILPVKQEEQMQEDEEPSFKPNF